MSYCRWSSDRFQCDLYCYEDASGGWTTHVAGNRPEPIPHEILNPYDFEVLAKFDFQDPNQHKDFMGVVKRWHDAMDSAKRHAVNSPHAGQSYNDPDLESFRARIVELSEDTELNVPDWLLPIIDEEIAEENSHA